VPYSAADIIRLAAYQAKFSGSAGTAPGQTEPIALTELNAVLDHICRTLDFAAAMGTWNFTFNTALTVTAGGNISQAGPNPLPMDYLRVSVAQGATGAQRSSKWYLLGVPRDMIEIDISQFDDQVQQAGTQSYPYYWAKDFSPYSVMAEVTGDVTIGNQGIANLSSTTNIVAGMSISGGIGPLSLITPGTLIQSVNSGASSLVLNQVPSLASPGQTTPPTFAGASLRIGYPGIGLPYPPPSGAYNAMIRYQRLMPRLTVTQVNNGVLPWFQDDQVLIDLLAERLMGYSDDSRRAQWNAFYKQEMADHIALADDRGNRGQTVQMDLRWFGSKFDNLNNTKIVGW